MSDTAYQRRKAVADAWKNERSLVLDKKGTRDWSQKEQREIIKKGKATGYQGHHMKSVDGHTTKAGDADNIQFLTRSEHLKAHNGDFHNNTNGYYDSKTGKTESFGRNKAQIEPKKLSDPLNDSQKRYAMSKSASSKKAEAARAKAKSTESRTVNKTKSSSESGGKTNRAAKSKTLANQRASAPAKNNEAAPKSKTLDAQRKSADKTATKSKTLVSQRSNPSHSQSRAVARGKGKSQGH